MGKKTISHDGYDDEDVDDGGDNDDDDNDDPHHKQEWLHTQYICI